MGDCKRQDFRLSKSVHPLKERAGGSIRENTSFSAGGLGLASLQCVLEFPSAMCRAKDNTAKSDVLAWGDALSRGFLLFLNAGSLPLQYGSSKENTVRRIVSLPLGEVVLALGC